MVGSGSGTDEAEDSVTERGDPDGPSEEARWSGAEPGYPDGGVTEGSADAVEE